ncbi:MAG: ATPase, T2SS/T4P/T4SS family [Candidatus Omnitrophota bacterium]
MGTLREKIIESILEKSGIDRSLVEKVALDSKNFNELKEKLIEKNITTEEEILLILSKTYKLPYFDLSKYKISLANKELLPKELALKYKVLPLSRIGDVLTLATANPLDVIAVDDIKIACAFKAVDLVLTNEKEISRKLHILYSEDLAPPSLNEEEELDIDVKSDIYREGYSLDSILKESKRPPIVRIVDLIIYEALKQRGSDIHIEPAESDLIVRYRVDGVLLQGLSLPKINQNAIIARIKIMSSLKITEFRTPQDGRFKIKFQGREIDFRVSTLPVKFGEKIVLRVLDKQNLSKGIAQLGFSKESLELFEEILTAPFGIILVTGPTGSGKSTTLYSVISKINTPDKNIITIEDPVEYQIEGITQIHVNPEIDITFASCLRSVLRQSPDVIMVGEIRDAETADIAIKASLTGELIFATLHTNNAVGALTRLVDMGVEPFLVASSLIASTAQRLVRKLCEECKQEYFINPQLMKRMGFFVTTTEKIYKAGGCKDCHNTGFKGRTALLEVLAIDDMLKDMIVKRTEESKIIEYARNHKNFKSLKEDGLKMCLKGTTSLEEVLRVAG